MVQAAGRQHHGGQVVQKAPPTELRTIRFLETSELFPARIRTAGKVGERRQYMMARTAGQGVSREELQNTGGASFLRQLLLTESLLNSEAPDWSRRTTLQLMPFSMLKRLAGGWN